MTKETIKLSNIKHDLEFVAYCNYSNIEDWRLTPALSSILLAGIFGWLFKSFWLAALISLTAIPNLVCYIKELIKYRTQKKELNDTLERGDLSISTLNLSHISEETIYEPHSGYKRRRRIKTVKFFNFTSGSSWRVPNVSKHYQWSNKYYLSTEGLENISVSGNEFYFVSLQGYPDVSYVYPCNYFVLDSELKK